MVRYGFLAGVMMVLAATTALAENIVVLTKTPVAEFVLPDGSVLKNAYVWRRNSQGLMIMHDGGNYFLNFKLLPDDWKTAYLGASDEGDPIVEPESPPTAANDKYRVSGILEKIPALNAETRRMLLSDGGSKDLDKGILALGLLQSLLSNERSEARRFLIIIEEKQYEIGAVDLDQLFVSCGSCAGDGQLARTCKACDGSGSCPKCKGEGTREAMKGSSRMHCTTCRGTGVCSECKGEGGFTPSCPKCRGVGKLLDRQYCEIVRDRFVREVNASVLNGKRASVASIPTSGIGKVLAEFPDLKPEARAFYLSDAYTGGMDTNILVACVLHSLLKNGFKEGERFDLMLRVEFPDDKVFEVENYLKPCGKCKKQGRIERDCRKCNGDGDCGQCEGSGKRMSEFGDNKTQCTICRGTGKCRVCAGDGKLISQCPACKGRGRIFERQRTEIKLGLLVDELNEYYSAQ